MRRLAQSQTGSRPARQITNGPVQRKRRLDAAEVNQLVAAYQAGSTLAELAAHFQIGRTAVAAHLERCGIPRRRTGLRPDQLPAAIELYTAGRSLAEVGEHFGVHASTVWRTFHRLGIAMRPRQGWDGEPLQAGSLSHPPSAPN